MCEFLLICCFCLCFIVCSEQDQGLEALSRVVGRQKQTALDIGNEVESQNGSFAVPVCMLHRLIC